MARISDSEIRLKVLESPEFAYSAGEWVRDNFDNEQAALLAYYLYASKDIEKAAAYALEILRPSLKHALEVEIDAYKDKHELNYDPEEE